MRAYQIPAARAIAESVLRSLGRQFVVIFSRQAGKDETLAQIVAWILTRYMVAGGSVVVAAPIGDQAGISQARLVSRLEDAPLTAQLVKTADNLVSVGHASARFLSADPKANVRGHTASRLLVANEAQDIDPKIWDARFQPMGASTNSTTVFMGTTWTKTGLLSRQWHYLEERDPAAVFLIDWEKVAAVLPAYGDRVRSQAEQHGWTHPYIRTEYCLEELDSEGGLFPLSRQAQLKGEHGRCRRAAESAPGSRFVLLLDVAGEEETDPGPESFDAGSKRDSTFLTVVRLGQEVGGKLHYEVVDRMGWTGVRHTALHAQLVDLAVNVWRAAAVVVDSNGVGAGLTSFLTAALKSARIHVHPFVFTQQSKSKLGWDLIGLIDGGRLKDYVADDSIVTQEFYRELGATQYEILDGPQRTLRWSVPASRGHDDAVMSWALVAYLDELDLRARVARGSGGDS